MEINKVINKVTDYILGHDHIDLPLTDREIELKELKRKQLKYKGKNNA